MSMTLKLIKNLSEDAVLDKTLTEISTKTGTLRAECDILDPVLTLSGMTSNDLGANYCYIQEFARYYFITGIRSIRSGLWELSMHVDVLSTYKDTIRAQTAVIARQENSYNLSLDDPAFKLQASKDIQTVEMPYGFTNPCFILAVAGS